jgi:hypothetical protein
VGVQVPPRLLMINYWLDRALVPVENELILVKPSPTTQSWYEKMPSIIPACCPDVKIIIDSEDYGQKVGHAHHLRFTKFGIEGVLKAPRKYHRYSFYVLYNNVLQPKDPFWIVFHKNLTIYFYEKLQGMVRAIQGTKSRN